MPGSGSRVRRCRSASGCQSHGVRKGWSGTGLLAVGPRIRELRGFDMTQAEFAERIGISQNYLSMMERGNLSFQDLNTRVPMRRIAQTDRLRRELAPQVRSMDCLIPSPTFHNTSALINPPEASYRPALGWRTNRSQPENAATAIHHL